MIKKNKSVKDIIIVGAGPAGSAAAYFFTKLGLDVWLLDNNKFPRAKPCGDGIGPRAVKMLHQIGLGDWLKEKDFYRIDKMRIISNSGRFVVSETSGYDFPFPYGYVIRRDVFDERLVHLATTAGAELRENFHVTSYLKQSGRITGIKGRYQEKDVEINSRLVVAADGSAGSFSRQFGAKISAIQALGYRGYAHNLANLDNYANIFFSDRLPKGYGWVFPLSDSSANVGIGTLGAGNVKVDLKGAFTDFVTSAKSPVALSKANFEEQKQGSVMRMNFDKRPLHLPGVAFVGDAAGLVSPINGEGIAHALESAEILAEALEGNFTDAGAIDKGLRGYKLKMDKQYKAYFRWGRFLSRLLAGPERLDKLIEKAQQDSRLAHALTGVLSNTVHPRELGRWEIIKRLL